MNDTDRPASSAYDAIVLVSFGGPEGPDDVMPFLENVTRGRGVPRERLEVVAEHYLALGGVSPINAANRELITALEAELADAGIDLPVYFGNRNWDPFLRDTLTTMAEAGVRRSLAFVTAAFSTYSGCRQYREDISAAREAVGRRAPIVDKIRGFGDHPLFVEAVTDRISVAVDWSSLDPATTRLVFTAHSIPQAMAANCDYVAQLTETARFVAAGLPADLEHDLVYQSRSGPPQVPWLEPDVNDHLRAFAAGATTHVIVVPLGFVSDHMEVIWDLDTEAAATADDVGLAMTRVPTAGTHPAFVEMIVELIRERMDPSLPRRALGSFGARPDICPTDCCLLPARPGRPG
jgi:ferrochelatase